MKLRHLPPDVILALCGVVALIAVVQTLRLALRSFGDGRRRRRLAAARERGVLGEVRAETLLRRLGFTIVGRQVAVTYGLGVDGESIPVDLRADYVVDGGGRRYVAEVKTGVFAPRLETAATRRQLLEYRIAFDVDGVLLVDADAERVRLVEFPLPASRRAGSAAGRMTWLLAGIAAGALAMIAVRAL